MLTYNSIVGVRLCAALVVCLALCALHPANAASSASLPEGVTPAGFVTYDDPNGGRIVYGPVHGPTSEAATFQAGLRTASGYFGKSFALVGVVRSKKGAVSSLLGMFRATLQGTPVAGLAVAAVDPHAGPRFALLFDRASRISTSLPALAAAASGSRPAQAPLAIRRVEANDGSLSLDLPSTWRTRVMEHGAYSVSAPDGAQVDTIPINVASNDRVLPGMLVVPFVSDPARAWVAVRRAMALQAGEPDPQTRIERSTPVAVPASVVNAKAAILTGTLSRAGSRRRFAGLVTTLPPAQPGGPWVLSLYSFCSAPVARFSADLPAMLGVAQSLRMNGRVLAQQNAEINAQIRRATESILASAADFRSRQQAMFESSMASARAAQDSIDRSTAGFVHYLSDSSVVNNAATGTHRVFDNGTADALVASNPSQFSVVPLSRYRKGVDY